MCIQDLYPPVTLGQNLPKGVTPKRLQEAYLFLVTTHRPVIPHNPRRKTLQGGNAEKESGGYTLFLVTPPMASVPGPLKSPLGTGYVFYSIL